MDKLRETVRKIYRANEIATFGIDPGSQDLPVEWQQFFRKKSQEIRGQEPEPEPELEEVKADVLPEILARIIARIEGVESKIEIIETRLDLIEAIDKEVEEQIQEPVRKGLDPSTFLLKMQLEGAHGELVNRGGRKWIES